MIDYTADVSSKEYKELKTKGLDEFREDIKNLENKLYTIKPMKRSGDYRDATYPELISLKKLLTLIKEGNGQFHYKIFSDSNKKKSDNQIRCWQVLDYERNKEEIERLVDEGRMSANEEIMPTAASTKKVSKLKNAHTSGGNLLQGYFTDIYEYKFEYTDKDYQKDPLTIKIYQVKKEKCNIPLPADNKE